MPRFFAPALLADTAKFRKLIIKGDLSFVAFDQKSVTLGTGNRTISSLSMSSTLVSKIFCMCHLTA